MTVNDAENVDDRGPLASFGLATTPPSEQPPFMASLVSAESLRWICVACGVVALCTLGFIEDGSQANVLAQFALVALGLATAIAWLQLTRSGRSASRVPSRTKDVTRLSWLLATIAVAVVSGVAVQSWFHPGTSIATGDIAPPEGIAWLGRVFEPWAWTGSNMGEPSQLPLLAPWAAILGAVHALGGSPELAQRIWYTLLFTGSALGAFAFMAALRMGPIAALAGAVVYAFNPYVVSEVNIYSDYIAAMGLVAALPAVLLAVGTGRLSIRWGALLIAASAPLLGYVFLNPPLVGLIIGTVVTTPLLAAWVDGKEAALRSARVLVLGAPLLLAASAYWIAPAILRLSGVAAGQLASLSSWTWTETRATIRNAFWLNPIWSWRFPEYFPYARVYESPPLSVARFLLPAMAFGALGLGRHPNHDGASSSRDRMLRIAVAASTVALLSIFLSTGTNAPGNLVFDRLYALPFGWLLREPGRFLMVVALAYAALIAVAVEALLNNRSVTEFARTLRLSGGAFKGLYVPAAVSTALLVGFPLYTGAVVPDSRPSLPPVHVHVPAYWTEMARAADALPGDGSVLVMPPDDFYQMPYTWGYYGNDGFIVDAFHRRVLVPNPQGYWLTSPQLLTAVDLTAQSILSHDWREVGALATALNAPFILVRRDIETSYPGRGITSPDLLAAALITAPNFTLIHTVGSLDLFALTKSVTELELVSDFVTINTQVPDLRLLPLFPPYSAFVSSESLVGVPFIVQAPAPSLWRSSGSSLVWQPTSPPSSTYRVADLDSKTVVTLDHAGTYALGTSGARVEYTPHGTNTVTVSVGHSFNTNSIFVLLASPQDPATSPPIVLALLHDSFSTDWEGSIAGQHVLVDGLANGWLIPAASDRFTVSYAPAEALRVALWISAIALIVLLAISVPPSAWFWVVGFSGRHLSRLWGR